ncbi:aminopeptidase N [Flexivirga sp. ID2601S]|uniref:Aminopeptidase N n=1 Tax=Flexivirga aerilata TaxID=1656889 RepID=A0A849AB76_9MICO|nr:aminopeptidase N [Flexivirga aerilata]NNG37775.1 aminopeptidase N [Flexivirga aerilata]
MTGDLNLTRDECAARSAAVTTHDQTVALDLSAAADPSVATFASVSTLRFTSTTEQTWLDLVADEVTELTVNGTPSPIAYDGARLQLTGLHTDGSDNLVRVAATCRYSHTGEGMHRFTDPVDGNTYAYTHFEPTDARRVFACFEQPDLKARFTVSVTAPTDWLAFANQPAVEETATAQVRTTTFAPTPPLSTYLVAVAVGPFHQAESSWSITRPDGTTQQIDLRVGCRASMAAHLPADEIFRITRQGLDFFDAAFEFPYPWGKYDQLFLPEYNIGAMEHPGLVTFNENVYLFRGDPTTAQRESRAEVIMHEMAHMWFGDLATPRWWDDTWLKESFADLMGYLGATEAAGFDGSWPTFALRRKQWAYEQDQLPTTHPVVADVPDLDAARVNFDGITYAKGAAVLKQLMSYVGRDAFFAGTRAYFRRHAFGNTTLTDLITCLEDAAGRDLSAWVDTWLRTSGPSTLSAALSGDTLTITQQSTDPLTGEQVSRDHRVIVSTFTIDGAGLRRTTSLPVTISGETTRVELPDDARADLVVLNDDDRTYAITALTAEEAQLAAATVGRVEPGLTRAVLWSVLWNLTRAAQLRPATFLDAVHANLPQESDAGPLAIVLGMARTAITDYLLPRDREAAGERLLRLTESALATADPGSDLQRAWAFALAADAPLTPAGGPAARRVLDGGIAGLPLTPTLRWELVTALAALGELDDEELLAHYAADSTMTGATAYAKALASRPGVAVKQEVWRELTEGTGLTNDRQRALLAGFAHAAPEDVAGFRDAYFAGLTTWWQTQPRTMAGRLVTGLFPRTSADEGVADNPVVLAARDWLERNADAPYVLRRGVIEQLDHTERRLRAQRA